MRLTDHTDYSLRVLIYLNRTKARVTLDDLAKNLGISRNNLIKVSNQLTKIELVDATRGRSGGIAISKNSGNKKLGDIVRQTEETFHMAGCFSGKQIHCPFLKGCFLKNTLQEGLNAFLDSLDKYTLDDVTPQLNVSGG